MPREMTPLEIRDKFIENMCEICNIGVKMPMKMTIEKEL